MRICTKYFFIMPQNKIKIISIWDTVAGVYGLGLWFCGGGSGQSTEINRLNKKLGTFWSEVTNWIAAMPRSGPGQLLTLVGYSSLLPKIAESILIKKVVLYRSLQSTNLNYHSVFPCIALCALTLMDPFLGSSLSRKTCASKTKWLTLGLNLAT